ncbi:nuclease-related domain-containing protein [Mycoplasma crocodyli]|uniref:NERD domain-containing protein n=1 Tax=Mycoplasma crocodyli (strain ATCC 51981 / MP145) TaxID=512564 RepID=D5E608_MYCCM|nr:nuclease-related domain-containing protein [Mycoplasma crocodyli]ADE19608.1 hypothetical protein MCRO_0584 [Mycoplasma crocodyli MP145]
MIKLNETTSLITNSEKLANFTWTIVGVVIMTLLVILITTLFTYLYLKNKKYRSKGFIFEQEVDSKIKTWVNKKNVEYIPGGTYSYNDNMFEIDGLIITSKAIIVVEDKYYTGNITGDANNTFLHLQNDRGKKKKINNPIIQNDNHIRHLFKAARAKFICGSLIVFEKNAKFNIKNVDDHVVLTTIDDISNTLDEMLKSLDSLPKTIDIENYSSMFISLKANTIKEQKKWKKITKTNSKTQRQKGK